jgi:two-component system, chemotaxis family, protein-glutamate methylesterase/glutaminase
MSAYSELMTDVRRIVVIGGSAGAIEGLTRLIGDLPKRLDAAIFVVVHMPVADSRLPAILGRKTRLIVKAASDGEPILGNRIYVAPPDYHLLIEPGRIKLSSGPKGHGHRPAINPLFLSAARAYGPRVVGIILSGMLDDGSLGLRVVRRQGGITMAQDPQEALFRQMPQNAIEAAHPRHIGTVSELASLVVSNTRQATEGREAIPLNRASKASAKAG